MKKAKRIVEFLSILIVASLLVSCSCGDDGGKKEEVYTPTLTSITPSSGYNTEDTPVTITGEHLSTPGSVVLKNGTTYPGPYDLTNISLPDDTTILATVPAGLPTDVYDVAVTIDSEELTLTDAFTVMTVVVTPSVSLDSIIPPLGYNGQDTPVMITGSGLSEPSSIVLRNGVENPGPFDLTNISLGSSTNILATVPAGLPPDVYDVAVVIDGVEYVLTAAFTVTDVPPPFVEYVRPPSGWNEKDTTITIKGRYFQATPIVSLISSTGGLIEL
ncbi:MAG: IPT/TIG domain-containing protein, partial [Deltaproteobacteria bacterium]